MSEWMIMTGWNPRADIGISPDPVVNGIATRTDSKHGLASLLITHDVDRLEELV